MKNNLYFLILYLVIVLSFCHRPSDGKRRSRDGPHINERRRNPFSNNCPPGHIEFAGECIEFDEFEYFKILGVVILIVIAIVIIITLFLIIKKIMNKYGIRFSPIFRKKTKFPVVYPSNYYPQVIHRNDCECRCGSNENNINNYEIGYTLLQNQSININS